MRCDSSRITMRRCFSTRLRSVMSRKTAEKPKILPSGRRIGATLMATSSMRAVLAAAHGVAQYVLAVAQVAVLILELRAGVLGEQEPLRLCR